MNSPADDLLHHIKLHRRLKVSYSFKLKIVTMKNRSGLKLAH